MYLRTEEEAQATEALCMASFLTDELERDLRQWRWVLISLHNAVQGFMVLSLRHGNSLAALTKECAAAWFEAHEKGGPYPSNEKLDSYLNLYKKVKSKNYGEYGGNKRFIPKGNQEESIKKLNEIRNNFIHFNPKGWSLEVDGFPQICLDCICLIEFLGWESDDIHWHKPEYRDHSKLCCYKLKNKMYELNKMYETIGS